MIDEISEEDCNISSIMYKSSVVDEIRRKSKHASEKPSHMLQNEELKIEGQKRNNLWASCTLDYNQSWLL